MQIDSSITNILSKNTFTRLVEEINKGRWKEYDFSSSIYRGALVKMKIRCILHDYVFSKTPQHLKEGSGCSKCSGKHRRTPEEYDTDLAKWNPKVKRLGEFKGMFSKTEHICDCGNIWNPLPSNLQQGRGCPNCKQTYGGWSYTYWETAGNSSKDFDSFKVYILECYNKNEKFYKIGKTYKKLTTRFQPYRLPYEYKVIKIIEGNARDISELERELQRDNKEYAYIPLNNFEGMYECFSSLS